MARSSFVVTASIPSSSAGEHRSRRGPPGEANAVPSSEIVQSNKFLNVWTRLTGARTLLRLILFFLHYPAAFVSAQLTLHEHDSWQVVG